MLQKKLVSQDALAQEADSSESPDAATPALLLEQLGELATQLHAQRQLGHALALRAVYAEPGSDKVYGGYRYTQLADPHIKGQAIEGKLPEGMLAALVGGQEYLFTGRVAFSIKSSQLRPLFQVCGVQDTPHSLLTPPGPAPVSSGVPELMPRAKRDVDQILLEASSLKVAVITGQSAVVLKDVYAAISGYESDIELKDVRAYMHDPADVAAKLEDCATENEVILIAIARGGGNPENLALLDDTHLYRALNRCSLPVVVAIGHAVDRLQLEDYADREFSTPSQLGNYLASVAQRRRKLAERCHSEQVRLQVVEAQKEIEKLRREREVLKKERLEERDLALKSEKRVGHFKAWATASLAFAMAMSAMLGWSLLR